MEEKNVVSVNLATDAKGVIIPCTVEWTAEDLCIKVCKQIGIGPVARHLFALRNRSTKLWCASGQKLEIKDKLKLDFRLRFKPSSIQRLKQIDIKAYDYYFLQARTDVLDNKVSEIVYEKHKRELIGLGVCDMYRVMLEKDIPREIVESDYKKYIPKECLKRHSFFVKKPIHNALVRLSGHDAAYVKDQYLNQLECMAPDYLLEEYKALMDRGIPNPPQKVLLRINSKEVKYTDMENNIEDTLCAIEDLCFISIRHDGTVEISRKNGIPTYLKFGTNALLLSFVSGLDGYYRLAIKWTFNLCRDLITPSLQKLHKMKCHGPVGGEFSYAKLEEKRSNRPGTFVLRESETKYNVFYLDVCGKDSKPRTRKIEQLGPDEFILSDSVQRYTSLAQLVAAHQDPENQLYLRECLPPSEYDKSPLLICASESGVSDVVADEELVTELLKDGPRCIPPQELQVYKAQPFRKHYELTSESKTPAITSYRAMWRIAKGKKLGVAIKILEEEESGMTREFFQLAGKWGQLRSTAIARLYGLMLAPAVGMVLELVRYGPLDVYLQTHASTQTIKTVDMVEAAACLATALWHLEENGVVHGNIRCRKLLVHTHNANSLVVKLADPGLFSYTQADVHWLPPECYGNAELAKRSSQADVWALATTFWQIFSRGAPIPPHKDIDSVKRYYSSGKRLPMPSGCPAEVYKLMLECWGEGGGSRKQPQAVMRDINQILYQVYNSRRIHAYETAFPKLFTDSSYIEAEKEIDSSDSESRASSLFTDRTSLVWDDDDEAEGESKEIDQDDQEELSSYLIWLAKVGGEKSGPLGQMQGIFELDADCNVILQGRIGQGFYGEVYKGLLERDNKDAEPQQVAVKKLKTQALEADLRDFEREISIMKTLKHENVVEILGVISEPEVCLVMEFVKHGSLQSYLAINRETLTHRKLLGFALDIATGMDYLGRKSIVHRDLAARNILVASENRVKISDFGLAQVTGINDYYILQTNRDLPIKWYAPESLRDGKFSPRSDVWSFGVTMYETFGFGDEPRVPGVGDGGNSEGSAELLEALERGSRLPCPPTCPQAVYVKLMYPCWQLQSHERPDFSTLCNDIQDLLTQY
ncbi:tyrosine-protein kinase hopscotch isoform X1 [Neodiprion fabricii]|uniref:tyrosine-protein kinase hopscotch isoform X1 n=1 Tax=Neodiprion fabricii TaxID=2872261 RepID=UPI001ED8EA94|nr:tyrosine-protein kinase hopscotch isoform X1 [Neodiprion fabricii]